MSNNRIWNLFQGDYIRHPVLYELSSKYGVAGSDQVPLPVRLDELREHIRREIRKVCRVSLILLGSIPLPRSSLFSSCIYTVAWPARARSLSRPKSSILLRPSFFLPRLVYTYTHLTTVAPLTPCFSFFRLSSREEQRSAICVKSGHCALIPVARS